MAKGNDFLIKLKEFIKSKVGPVAKYCWDFLWIAFLYGLILSFSLSTLFPSRITFSIKTLFACGIAFYFIKEELPRIILRMQQPKRPGGEEY